MLRRLILLFCKKKKNWPRKDFIHVESQIISASWMVVSQDSMYTHSHTLSHLDLPDCFCVGGKETQYLEGTYDELGGHLKLQVGGNLSSRLYPGYSTPSPPFHPRKIVSFLLQYTPQHLFVSSNHIKEFMSPKYGCRLEQDVRTPYCKSSGQIVECQLAVLQRMTDLPKILFKDLRFQFISFLQDVQKNF